jgi:glutaminyl-tRNA synthetase
MVVLEPLKVNIVNFPGNGRTELTVPDFPDFPEKTSHSISFAGTIYIEQSDFKLEADKNFRRLTKDQVQLPAVAGSRRHANPTMMN